MLESSSCVLLMFSKLSFFFNCLSFLSSSFISYQTASCNLPIWKQSEFPQCPFITQATCNTFLLSVLLLLWLSLNLFLTCSFTVAYRFIIRPAAQVQREKSKMVKFSRLDSQDFFFYFYIITGICDIIFIH